MIVVEHLEKYLGQISKAAYILDKKYNLTISLFENVPFEDIRTYTTLGMNRYFVDYYYEFIFVCLATYNENEITSLLTSFAEYLIDGKKGVRRGDVLSFNFSMTSETKMNSLYFSLPFYFDDNISQLQLENKTVIFSLIIPIYQEEADLIESKGWSSFENFLEENEIDNLWDLRRDKYYW